MMRSILTMLVLLGSTAFLLLAGCGITELSPSSGPVGTVVSFDPAPPTQAECGWMVKVYYSDGGMNLFETPCQSFEATEEYVACHAL